MLGVEWLGGGGVGIGWGVGVGVGEGCPPIPPPGGIGLVTQEESKAAVKIAARNFMDVR